MTQSVCRHRRQPLQRRQQSDSSKRTVTRPLARGGDPPLMVTSGSGRVGDGRVRFGSEGTRWWTPTGCVVIFTANGFKVGQHGTGPEPHLKCIWVMGTLQLIWIFFPRIFESFSGQRFKNLNLFLHPYYFNLWILSLFWILNLGFWLPVLRLTFFWILLSLNFKCEFPRVFPDISLFWNFSQNSEELWNHLP